METRNEKWQSLKLEAQKFTPQEYCYTCWRLELRCEGNDQNSGHHYAVVYDTNGNEVGTINPSHGGAHPQIIMYIKTPEMDVFDASNLDEYDYSYSGTTEDVEIGLAVGHAHGAIPVDGYYWGPGGKDIHFATTLNIQGLDRGVS